MSSEPLSDIGNPPPNTKLKLDKLFGTAVSKPETDDTTKYVDDDLWENSDDIPKLTYMLGRVLYEDDRYAHGTDEATAAAMRTLGQDRTILKVYRTMNDALPKLAMSTSLN